MSLFYRIAYGVSVTPWEHASETHGYMIGKLIEREEDELDLPFGPVLDLGCGSGFWSVIMAKRGWQVVGIDNVPKALNRAKERAKQAKVKVRFVQGDVAQLPDIIDDSNFRFFLDLGCFHGLNDGQRHDMGQAVNGVAAPEATLLTLAWKPGFRGPLPRGAGPGDLEKAFRGWKVIADDPIVASALPVFLRNADPRCYRLRRM